MIDMRDATPTYGDFWSKVQIGEPDECWLWLASTNRDGYGQVWNRERKVMELAHRVAFMLAGGDLPSHAGVPGASGVLVLHGCDNPPCANPRHLRDGSQTENMADMIERSRFAPVDGELNPRAKLTVEQVEAIRRAYTGRYGEKSQIARDYGISTSQVSKILLGQAWRAA